MTKQELCRRARDMLSRSYSPYSHFPVGAAIECADGSVYTGCNIENAAYGPSICAERVAVFKAVSEGKRDFVRIAVAGATKAFCAPCGVCRQVMMEFCDPETFRVILAKDEKHWQEYRLQELLPMGFGPDNLKKQG